MSDEVTFRPLKNGRTMIENSKKQYIQGNNTITITSSEKEFNRIITYRNRRENFRYKKII